MCTFPLLLRASLAVAPSAPGTEHRTKCRRVHWCTGPPDLSFHRIFSPFPFSTQPSSLPLVTIFAVLIDAVELLFRNDSSTVTIVFSFLEDLPVPVLQQAGPVAALLPSLPPPCVTRCFQGEKEPLLEKCSRCPQLSVGGAVRVNQGSMEPLRPQGRCIANAARKNTKP